jgi:hypothetical protein
MAQPPPNEVDAYVATCLGDMGADIDRIVAAALSEARGRAGGAPASPLARAHSAAPAAAAPAPLPPPVMLRRRPEATVELYDPPAAGAARLPEGLPPGPAPGGGAAPLLEEDYLIPPPAVAAAAAAMGAPPRAPPAARAPEGTMQADAAAGGGGAGPTAAARPRSGRGAQGRARPGPRLLPGASKFTGDEARSLRVRKYARACLPVPA